ncbi:MAG: transketolase, partial [Chloroflexaceae bacterium]|nr:transketolase [Chloroflexaceae bacterium]
MTSATPTVPTSSAELEQLSVNTIRGLSMDGVQQANSGHPGLPMGMADIAYVVWARYLKHNPTDPTWPDRDRFVLSAGHGSMLLYSLLHLTGYDLPLEELQNFRQWGSKTPGHPEVGLTPGVETTTGPLGQGIANAVGFALAEAHLAAIFNRPDFPLVDHDTYVFISDGDLMEGISHEAASLAGHLKLHKLMVIYDDNNISLDGPTHLSYSEDVGKRFEAYGWHVQRIDGHDRSAIAAAVDAARANAEQPSIIIARTQIGYGSPNKQGSAKAHGSPLGEEEVRLSKAALGIPTEPLFYVPDEVRSHMGEAIVRGQQRQGEWQTMLEGYRAAHPAMAQQWDAMWSRQMPDWNTAMPTFDYDKQGMATRKASEVTLNAYAAVLPALLGGSADLHTSNNTLIKGSDVLAVGAYANRNIYYGVREHAMAAAMVGMTLHGGVIPYGGTFLVFSDYMRNTIRLAALSHAQVIFVYTHDSIGLGEDGPTHQPIEHLASLRAIPNLAVVRPADATETAYAWRIALERTHGPTALVFTRQNLP